MTKAKALSLLMSGDIDKIKNTLGDIIFIDDVVLKVNYLDDDIIDVYRSAFGNLNEEGWQALKETTVEHVRWFNVYKEGVNASIGRGDIGYHTEGDANENKCPFRISCQKVVFNATKEEWVDEY